MNYGSNAHAIKNENMPKLFENLIGLVRAKEVAEALGVSIHTIYKWRSNGKTRKVPDGLFVTFNKSLYVQTEILKRWVSDQNPELQIRSLG